MSASCKSDPFPQVQDFWQSSPSLEQESSSSTARANFSDEEVTINLASNNPKKRAGRKKFRETRHPVYRGVRRRNSGKWVCEVREPNKKTRIWLGTFPTVEMAARAHDVAAMALRGRQACLNFADSAWRLPAPASRSVKDIQRAAAEAAEAFREKAEDGSAAAAAAAAAAAGCGEASAAEVVEESSGGDGGVFFMDDDMVFGMHALLDDLAEGLMMSPPRFGDDVELNDDVSLWSFSV